MRGNINKNNNKIDNLSKTNNANIKTKKLNNEKNKFYSNTDIADKLDIEFDNKQQKNKSSKNLFKRYNKKQRITACICLVVIIAFCSTYKIYSEASTVKVTVPKFVRCKAAKYTHVLKEPKAKSKKLGRSYAGYVHRLIGTKGNYYKVYFYNTKKNVVGYVPKKQFVKVSPRLGIDVSKWQKSIDWKKVASTKSNKKKISFAMIRLGYSNNVGKCFVDSKYNSYIKGASKNKLKVGVYFYSKAKTVKDAQKEANFVIKKLAPYKSKIKMPVVFDFEENNILKKLSKNQATNICNAFINKIKAKGYKARIYSCEQNIRKETNYRNLPCRAWIAKYPKKDNGKKLSYPYLHCANMWQFTSNGHVNGIKGRVDMDWDMSP